MGEEWGLILPSNISVKPVLYYCLRAFEKSCVDGIMLVCGKGQVDYCRENIIDKYKLGKVLQVLEGGNERHESVCRALMSIEKAGYVLIHDGARPFITSEMIDRTVCEVVKHKACVVGTPVKDTIKVVNKEGFVLETPDRNTLWSVQTPQAFEYGLIRHAYELMNRDEDAKSLVSTDDAFVYERYIGKPVKIIPGDYGNLKLTTPEDLITAQALAEKAFVEL
jgi:2-C-methyl-D-erythritol 4-phosphate cytidylyltransferase